MAHSRVAASKVLAEGTDLTAAMVGIGMLFAAKAATEPNIEDTLLAASIEGTEPDDLRVLAVLVAKRHSTYRSRVLMGPTYQADRWALLDREPSLSAS